MKLTEVSAEMTEENRLLKGGAFQEGRNPGRGWVWGDRGL